jgi:hypothetical protein
VFRKKIILPVICVVLLLVLVVIDQYAPRPINWQISLSAQDRIPYGCFLTHHFLPELFPGKDIVTAYDSLYDTLKGKTISRANYIIVTHQFDPDALDVKLLMNFVAEGNTVFIAAHTFGKELNKVLSLKTRMTDFDDQDASINFANPELRTNNGYILEKGSAMFYLSSFNKNKATLLGVNAEKKATFIKMQHSKGYIFVHTIPYAFTNYYLLKADTSEYIYTSLSYLPVATTFWDEYYKPNKAAPDTPLRFVLSHAPLSAAYYLALCSIILFIFFKARRTQRIIPEHVPLANDTLDFVTTVGRLYYQQANHQNIADKKVRYFCEFLHTHYFVQVSDFSEAFAAQIAAKADLPEENIKELFRYIEYIRNGESISEHELVHLHILLEDFYQKAL